MNEYSLAKVQLKRYGEIVAFDFISYFCHRKQGGTINRYGCSIYSGELESLW